MSGENPRNESRTLSNTFRNSKETDYKSWLHFVFRAHLAGNAHSRRRNRRQSNRDLVKPNLCAVCCAISLSAIVHAASTFQHPVLVHRSRQRRKPRIRKIRFPKLLQPWRWQPPGTLSHWLLWLVQCEWTSGDSTSRTFWTEVLQRRNTDPVVCVVANGAICSTAAIWMICVFALKAFDFWELWFKGPASSVA